MSDRWRFDGRPAPAVRRSGVAFGLAVVLMLAASVGAAAALMSDAAAASRARANGPITFALVQPFTGPDAAFAPTQVAACDAAVATIKEAGGILGDTNVSCQAVDTRGDPADAVPAVGKMLSTMSGLVGIDGPTSDEAAAVVPRINAAGIPMFSDTGQSLFDKNNYSYFYRIIPSDAAAGYAMALYAYKKGFRSAAAIYGNDIGSQGTLKTNVDGFKALGGKVVASESIPLDQTSYSSIVQRVVSAHPQVIFLSTDPQTAATVFTEMRQISGKLLPVVGAPGTQEPPFAEALNAAVGKATWGKYYTGTAPYAPLKGPAFKSWVQGLHKAAKMYGSKMPGPLSKWTSNSYGMMGWDAVNLMALAMLETHSTNPKVFNAKIVSIANGSRSAVAVHSFAQGKAALARGKAIHYIGALGRIQLDKYHNSPGVFEVVNAGATKIVSLLTAKEINKVKASATHSKGA
jgi:branched-chain amino acid transport system substrate-binding protein